VGRARCAAATAQGRRALRRLPHARLVGLPGCGHLPFHDDTAAVAAALLAGAER
jgi:pimeloyl-ACP methyl ester carboxylesterase